MNNTKHTPGPWHYSGDSLTHRQFDIYAPGNSPQQHVCTTNNLSVEKLYSRDPDVALANARLIAAAPELLEALNGMVGLFLKPEDLPEDYVYRKEIAMARAAIAKATGGAA